MRNQVLTIILSIGLWTGTMTSANAALISGSVAFFNGLDTLGNVVSDLTLFDIGAPTTAVGGTGDMAVVSGPTETSDIDILAPGGVIYANSGFEYTLQFINSIVATPISCNAGICVDSVTFGMVGVVTAPGFVDTFWIGNFTANGVCLDAGDGTCVDESASGNWSSSLVVLAEKVPTPNTLALFGISLLAFRLARSRLGH